MNFGKKLQQKRNTMKLTQEEVADQLFVSRQTISNWENEVSYPDLNMLVKISDLYNLSLDKLIKANESMRISLSKEGLNRRLNLILLLLVINSLIMVTILLLQNLNPSITINSISRFMIVAAVIINSFVIVRTSVFLNNINSNHMWEYMSKVSLKLILLIAVIVTATSSILVYFHQDFITGIVDGVWIGFIVLWVLVRYIDDSK
ncbi:helix-turn-helix domain-containing protein [Companilactobacillus metriopterae]|uniref:helix-turn-helix domain-containing protein n=1 Tax=Companilactobacillus metriopterae TaxID=1909267 RepID=UPI00100B2BC5|nr:helix-turn-helix transcriptional regulator [Companilactobacillus metriopterae]